MNVGKRPLPPVERAGIDDHAADRRAVAADPFRCRRDDDVRAEVDGAGEITARAERVVDDEGDAVLLRNL